MEISVAWHSAMLSSRTPCRTQLVLLPSSVTNGASPRPAPPLTHLTSVLLTVSSAPAASPGLSHSLVVFVHMLRLHTTLHLRDLRHRTGPVLNFCYNIPSKAAPRASPLTHHVPLSVTSPVHADFTYFTTWTLQPQVSTTQVGPHPVSRRSTKSSAWWAPLRELISPSVL